MQHIGGRRTFTKRELLSLIGKLAFACKVVPPGRLFLRRLIDLSTTATHLHHHVALNKAARADLAWWTHFLPTWPGSSLFLQSQWTLAPDMQLFTDASNLGYGAYWAGRWFNQTWSPEQVTFTIPWRELYVILVACSTWGHLWPRKRILFYCDNAAVVEIWGKGSCKNVQLMTLVRNLFLMAARGNYHVAISHIPGIHNCIADHLSRFSMQAFWLAVPAASPHLVIPRTPALRTDLYPLVYRGCSYLAWHHPPDTPTKRASPASWSFVLCLTSPPSSFPPHITLLLCVPSHVSPPLHNQTVPDRDSVPAHTTRAPRSNQRHTPAVCGQRCQTKLVCDDQTTAPRHHTGPQSPQDSVA